MGGVGLKDVFGDPKNGVVKCWVIWARIPFAILAVLIFGCICVKLWDADAKSVDATTKLLFAAWTIAVPLYFFVETVYGINPKFAEQLTAKLDQFKASQDAARGLWAGCAAAIAVLILKPGS